MAFFGQPLASTPAQASVRRSITEHSDALLKTLDGKIGGMEKQEVYRTVQFTLVTRKTVFDTWLGWAEIGIQPPGTQKIVADLSSVDGESLRQYPTEDEAIRAARTNAQRVIDEFMNGCSHSLIEPIFTNDGEETSEMECRMCGERFTKS